jgi:hypothetical protein
VPSDGIGVAGENQTAINRRECHWPNADSVHGQHYDATGGVYNGQRERTADFAYDAFAYFKITVGYPVRLAEGAGWPSFDGNQKAVTPIGVHTIPES